MRRTAPKSAAASRLAVALVPALLLAVPLLVEPLLAAPPQPARPRAASGAPAATAASAPGSAPASVPAAAPLTAPVAAPLTAPVTAPTSATASTAGATLEPQLPHLGQRATLRLRHAPADSTHQPVGIGVAVLPGSDPAVYTAVPLRVGRVGIALPPQATADVGKRAAPGDTLWWQVPGALAQAIPDSLRPLALAPRIRPNWLPTLLIVSAVLAPPILWLLRRRRGRPARTQAFPLPAEPPHRIALRRLAEIAATRWLEDGQFDHYFVEATRTLRAYITGRYRVPALDWTSDEVVERLRGAGYDRKTVGEVFPLLSEADRVKFAAARPTQHAAQQWLGGVRTWIEGTAVEPRYTTPEAVAAAITLTQRSS
jgi:hypothetical protein